MSSYQRISGSNDNDNDNEDDDIEDGVVRSPLQPQVRESQTQSLPEAVSMSSALASCVSDSSSPEDYSKGMTSSNLKIKILKGEQSKEITVPPLATVAQLKSIVETAYSVPVAQQRLVFKGKPLRPNEDSLASFHIISNSVIHLFPLPAAANSAASSTTATTNNISSVFNLSLANTHDDMRIPGIPPHLMRPLHFVPEVVQCIREVKMWCYILLITSAMDIFTNLSFLGSQGMQFMLY
jgi:hypothetical protein